MYSITDLLEQVERENAVPLYLPEGLPPVFALRGKPYHPELSSVMLFPVEGPALTREELTEVLRIVRGAGYVQGDDINVAEFRYRCDVHDYDVFVFTSPQNTHIEFRRPYLEGTFR